MYLDEFESWLLDEGKAPKTIHMYLTIVKEFIKWFEDGQGTKFDPDVIEPKDIHYYRSHLETVGKQAPTTVNKKIATLKTYWHFLVDTQRTKNDPSRKVKMKTISRLHLAPRWLTRTEQRKFLEMIQTEKNDWKRVRNFAIAQIMLQAGLRISEVTNLNLDDFKNLNQRRQEVVIVRMGKGGKFRTVPLNKDAVEAIKEWLAVRGDSKNNDPAVFISERRSRMTDRAIRKALEKYFRMAGIDASPHCLRHTAAKKIVDESGQLTHAMLILGHENIQTTQRYVTPSEDDIRKTVESIGSDHYED